MVHINNTEKKKFQCRSEKENPKEELKKGGHKPVGNVYKFI